eukprot:4550440-Amphidinium_carterae.2
MPLEVVVDILNTTEQTVESHVRANDLASFESFMSSTLEHHLKPLGGTPIGKSPAPLSSSARAASDALLQDS